MMYRTCYSGHDAEKVWRKVPQADQVRLSPGLHLCLGKGENLIFIPGLRIRSIFGRIRILLFKKVTFFLSRIFFAWFMTKKIKKCHLKCPHLETFVVEVFSCHEIWKFEKAQFTNNGVLHLYIAREGSGSGIRIRWKTFGSGSCKKVRIWPDPQPWWSITYTFDCTGYSMYGMYSRYLFLSYSTRGTYSMR